MPIRTYDYIAEPFYNRASKQQTKIYRPKVIIKLGYNHKITKQYYECLVDSGADYNLFPAYIGASIGIIVDKGLYWPIVGIGNVQIASYRHKVKLYLDTFTYDADVYFSDSQQIPLLGRKGFFDCFGSLEFLEKEKKLKITI